MQPKAENLLHDQENAFGFIFETGFLCASLAVLELTM